jgi:hypothetical protein
VALEKVAGSSPVGHPPRNGFSKPNTSKRGKSRKERPDFLTRFESARRLFVSLEICSGNIDRLRETILSPALFDDNSASARCHV